MGRLVIQAIGPKETVSKKPVRIAPQNAERVKQASPLVVSPQAPAPRARSRLVIPRSAVVNASRTYRAPQNTVTLGDVARDQFARVSQALKDESYAWRTCHLKEDIVTDVCFSGGRRIERQRVRVGYVRRTKPVSPDVLPQDPPSVRICYADGDQYGHSPYVSMRTDALATVHHLADTKTFIPIMGAGMFAKMDREMLPGGARWVYSPCTKDGEVIDELVLTGRCSAELVEACPPDYSRLFPDTSELEPICLLEYQVETNPLIIAIMRNDAGTLEHFVVQ